MYYRVAIQRQTSQRDRSPSWQWISTSLSSLGSLLQWLQVYRAFPPERLRIFSSSSRKELNEQLARENWGLASASVTATQFLHERLLHPPTQVRRTSAREGGTSMGMVSMAVLSQEPCDERDRDGSALEKWREELELGPGGDHDSYYCFVLPASVPQVLTWMRLMGKIQRGEIEP